MTTQKICAFTIVVAALFISGCNYARRDTPNSSPETKTHKMGKAALQPEKSRPMLSRLGDPARLPGVVVYHPEPDSEMQYIEEKDQILDTKTGERFWLKTPHAEGLGRYGLVTPTSELVVVGGYYTHRYIEDGKHSVVYDIVSTSRWEPGAPDYTPEEVDVSRFASFIRAKHDAKRKGADIEVTVVDSRKARQSL